jgi:hypothetical protein
MRIVNKSRMSDTSPNGQNQYQHDQEYSDYENKLPTLSRVRKTYSNESNSYMDKNG